jgi:hypothetical protein
MDQEHHPSAEFCGLKDERELAAFKCQLRDYAGFLSNWIKQRKQSGETIVEDLPQLVILANELTNTFHLQCRLLQLAVWQYQHGEISRKMVEEILQTLTTIIRGLVMEPPTERTTKILVRAHEWLSILDVDYPNQLIVAHSTSDDLTIQDHLLWTSLERQQVAHVWWNWRRLITQT